MHLLFNDPQVMQVGTLPVLIDHTPLIQINQSREFLIRILEIFLLL